MRSTWLRGRGMATRAWDSFPLASFVAQNADPGGSVQTRPDFFISRLLLLPAVRCVLDLEPPAAIRFRRRRRHRDLQYAVPERRLRALRDHALRQRDAAMELAVLPLAVEVALALFLVLLSPLAPNRQRVVGDLDLNVFLLQARQLGANDEAIGLLERFDVRGPQSLLREQPRRRPGEWRPARETEPGEQAI